MITCTIAADWLYLSAIYIHPWRSSYATTKGRISWWGDNWWMSYLSRKRRSRQV